MKILYDTAIRLLYTPYLWGGDDFTGFDCSGLVQELLRSGGGHPFPYQDYTAQMLFDYFRAPANHNSQDPELGALVFYGNDTRHCDHVAMCLSRKVMIEAGGGGSKIKSISEAVAANAYVRVRPIRFDHLLGIFQPDYSALAS